MKISVIGLGKIGLPLAVQYASKGHTVSGVDIDKRVVEMVNNGKEPFPGEDGLAQALDFTVKQGSLSATSAYEHSIPTADIVVVVVPLFVDDQDQPDFGSMDSATRSIGRNLSKSTVVIYETTLPIGTTRNRWKPLLEEFSGISEGTDFHIVFSPERVLTGRVFEDLKKYPKLLGALSRTGAAQATEFYNSVIDFYQRDDLERENGVWDLGSPEAAELAKLAETSYRDVNIALANQFALHSQEIGVDVHKVIEACNSQPFSNIHRPGISVGGHCIPVYPRLYLTSDRTERVISSARRLNAAMPKLALDEIERNSGSLAGKNVVILGLAYRPGVKEDAFSGAYSLVTDISKRGGRPTLVDPLYTAKELCALGLKPCLNASSIEVVILHTDHPEFREIGQDDFPEAKVVYDGRHHLDASKWNNAQFIALGVPPLAKD